MYYLARTYQAAPSHRRPLLGATTASGTTASGTMANGWLLVATVHPGSRFEVRANFVPSRLHVLQAMRRK